MFTEIWYVEVMQSNNPGGNQKQLRASESWPVCLCISWWESVFLTKHANAALPLLLKETNRWYFTGRYQRGFEKKKILRA